MPNDYHTQAQLTRTRRLREFQRELPDFCSDYFMAIEQQTSVLTRLSYAYDLKLFFQYLSDELPKFGGKPVVSFTAADIQQVTKQDLERYARYLTLYVKNETLEDGEVASREMTNHEYGIKRKYASLRAFYKYLFAEGLIESNTASLIPLPKLHEHAIIRLDVDEVARILDVAESGQSLPKACQKYHHVTRKRDVAMLSLFLGTGIRISECVGLNIDDFDFEQNAFVVTRKGGKEVILYLSDEVAEALKDYLAERKEIEALPAMKTPSFCRSSGGGLRSAPLKTWSKNMRRLPRRSRKKSARISSAALSALIFTVKPEIFISLPTYWDIRTSTRRANTTRPSPRIIAVLPRRKPSCAKIPSISNRLNKNRFIFRQIRFKQSPERRKPDFAKPFGVHIYL